jgi:glycosyltransferase involved in cell wall biosynthesis
VIKVSIIVPVYNAEKKLHECIKSILSSSLQDIELILVDDGSQDNSYLLCKKIAEVDDRVVLIQKGNEGAGLARNAGIEIAKGEYLGFVDADDYIDSNMYEKMYNYAALSNADIAMCGVYRVGNYGYRQELYLPYEDGEQFDRESIKEKVIPLLIAPKVESKVGEVIVRAMWCRIFKRSLLFDNNIKFTNHGNGQDWIFTLNATYLSNKMVIVKEPMYYYRYNQLETLSKRYTEDIFERHIALQKSIIEILSRNNASTSLIKRMDQIKRHDVFWVIRMIISRYNAVSFKNKLKQVKDILNHSETIKVFNNINWSELSFQQGVLYFLIKNKLNLLLVVAVKYYGIKKNRI